MAAGEINAAKFNLGKEDIPIINGKIQFNGGGAGSRCKICDVNFRSIEEFGLHHAKEHLSKKKFWRSECSCGGGLHFQKYCEAFAHLKEVHYCKEERKMVRQRVCGHPKCQELNPQQN